MMGVLPNSSGVLNSLGVNDSDQLMCCHPCVIDFQEEHGLDQWPLAGAYRYRYFATFTSDEFCDSSGFAESTYLQVSNNTPSFSSGLGAQSWLGETHIAGTLETDSYGHTHASNYVIGGIPCIAAGGCDPTANRADAACVYDQDNDRILIFYGADNHPVSDGYYRKILSNTLILSAEILVMPYGAYPPLSPCFIYDDNGALHCWAVQFHEGDEASNQIAHNVSSSHGDPGSWGSWAVCSSNAVQSWFSQLSGNSWFPWHMSAHKDPNLIAADGTPVVWIAVSCRNLYYAGWGKMPVALFKTSLGTPTTLIPVFATDVWLLEPGAAGHWDEDGCYKPEALFTKSGSQIYCRLWYDGFSASVQNDLDITAFTQGGIGIYLPLVEASKDSGEYAQGETVTLLAASGSSAVSIEYGWGETPPESPATYSGPFDIVEGVLWFRGVDSGGQRTIWSSRNYTVITPGVSRDVVGNTVISNDLNGNTVTWTPLGR